MFGRVLTNEDAAQFFSDTPVRIAGNVNLRVPQIDGYEAARASFADGGHRAVERIPVGRGKTGSLRCCPSGLRLGECSQCLAQRRCRERIAPDIVRFELYNLIAAYGLVSSSSRYMIPFALPVEQSITGIAGSVTPSPGGGA